MDVLIPDKESRYYLKLFALTLGIGMEVLHQYFEQKILNSLDFYVFLEKYKHCLFHECYPTVQCCECSQISLVVHSKKGCLSEIQFHILFDTAPPNKQDHYKTGRNNKIIKDCLCRIDAKRSIDVDCMDVTLMCAIIKSCLLNNKTSINGYPGDLETIRDTRNFLAHSTDLHISKSEFETRMALTEQAIIGIASVVGNYFAKLQQRKINAFKNSELTMEGLKAIIESNADEIKKDLQTLIEDQRENTMLIKDEIIEHLQKYQGKLDELSIDIGNLRFEVKEYAVKKSDSCTKDGMVVTQGADVEAVACSSKELVTSTDDLGRKCRVEWRLETPNHWDLAQIKETLDNCSSMLKRWFEIQFVYVGSLVIHTLVTAHVVNDRDKMRMSVHSFLRKVVEVCMINTDDSSVIRVALMVESDGKEAFDECENCRQKDNIMSGLKDKIFELSHSLSAYQLDEDVPEKTDDDSLEKQAQTAIEKPQSLVELRHYQNELAEIAMRGENTIMCAGTNAGKTYVAFHVIQSHLLKNPRGKVVFINKTNVLLGQQYKRACDTFTTLHFQGKIKIWKADEDDSDNFETEIAKARLIFLTPKSLCNHLIETSATKLVSIDIFTLIVLDECHHTHDKSVYNELMSYYRIAKYREMTHRLPQILGLTASPGTNKAKDLSAAKDHLRIIMANLDVTKLSVVQRNREELLQYTSIPEKVPIASTTRKTDPLKDILLGAMEYVENKLNSRIVSNFLTENLLNNRDLYEALGNPPVQRTDVRYIQWIGETKEKVEHVLHKDPKVPRLLHACLRHLELYTECLEINSLLEIDQVRENVMQRYADESFASQNANTTEETEIVSKLRDVFAELREIGRNIEGNPDVKNVIERIENEYKLLKEESRFIIFVKAGATAKALAERLPSYLRSTHLTGSHKSVEEAGLPAHEQIEVLEKFKNGEHLCIVATSVGCEGLDVPQCNMMIRYRFSADEISSLQMRGRVRKKEGREVIVDTSQEFETEKKNIQRQYLMTQAIDEVSKLNITRDIAIAEKMIYEIEEIERRTANIKLNQKRKGLFTINCKYCGVVITDGDSMRQVNEKLFLVCDRSMLARVDRRQITKKKQRKFDGCIKLGKAYGRECGHNWGSIVIYKECEFVALSQDCIKIFDRQADSFINCEKWYDLKFKIEEISDEDFMNYNR